MLTHHLKTLLILLAVGSLTATVARAQEFLQLASCNSSLCDNVTCGAEGCCDTSCDALYDSGCDSLGCGSGKCPLLSGWGCSGDKLSCMKSLIKPSDHCFDDFISPMSNFVFFEDPRTLTELRPIFVNHWVPSTIGNGVSAGGTIQLMAVQFRAALSERLSIIGVKDGYIWDNTDGTLDTLLDEGWAAISGGLKYNLIRNTETGTLLSGGLTYEMTTGSDKALQDVANGEFHLFGTAGQRFLDGNAHYMTAFGWRVPVDGFAQSESVHWSNHLDVRLTNCCYVVTELTWWHWTDEPATAAAAGVAGQDLFNLNFSGVDNNDLVYQSIGGKYKPNGHIELGLNYEIPLTDFQDVLLSRLQTEMIFRY